MKTILLALIISSSAWAIPEAEIKDRFAAELLPAFDQLPVGNFKNSQGMNIRYRAHYTNPQNRNLVIVPGRTEPAKKYAEVIYDLKSENFNIFIIDHQGQGESDRRLDDPHKGHVVSFRNYDRDFDQWMREVVLPATKGENLYLLAHSMGGAISTRYIAANPGIFKKVVLNAPMFEIFTEPYPGPVARAFAQFLVLTGKGQEYAPAEGPYVPEEDTIEVSTLTHSEARQWMNKYLFVEYPEVALGGPTARWVNETLKATQFIHYLGKKIKTPILLLQAGQDEIVKPKRQTKFCQLAVNCKLVHYSQAQHEILQEEDKLRRPVLELIKQFLL